MPIMKCPSCGTALNIPEQKKTGVWWGIGCLIAALAIPVIVAIIGLLAAIAIPSFVKARETAQVHACVNNMRMLDSAKEQVAMEKGYVEGRELSEAELDAFISGGLAALQCPRGGSYTLNPLGVEPACSVHGPMSEALNRRSRH